MLILQATEPTGSATGFVLGTAPWLLLFAAYWTPTLVALVRKHSERRSIFLVNLFAGWTVIGWVAALVWSATAVKPPPADDPHAGGARS